MNIKKLYEINKNMILYLFFGICTTVVNVVAYWIMAHPLHFGTMLSTVIAWILAVLFAYITNRKWVFCSKAYGRYEILRELAAFFICRLATGGVDWMCMLMFVNILSLNDIIVKFTANIIVIVLNYVASKLVIFRHKEKV